MSASSRKWLLAFATLGLAASMMSSYVHYGLLTDAGFTSVCDVSTTVSCTQAYLSRYGSFFGVPVAVGGLMYFALVLVIVGLAGRSSSPARENAPAYVFALSTLALAFVLYLAWASFFVLKNFCIFCTATYVAVIGIFIISGGATSFPMTSLPGRARRDVRTLVSSPLALIVTLLFVAGAATAIAAFPRDAAHPGGAGVAQAPAYTPLTPEEKQKVAEWWEVQPKIDVPVPDGGAKVLIVKFNDYQCPACAMTHNVYKDVLHKYTSTGQAKYVVKHYPLEGECNSSVPNGNHFASCEAAAGVIMARAKGTADKLEDWIFSKIGPPPLTPAQVRQAARDVGGVTDYEEQYARVIEEVKTDAGLGALLKVNSTPTFFINGRRVPTAQGIPSPAVIDAIIEAELKRVK
jgi:uncharacterized membrane protein/protein-disulfide isomerase